MDKKSHIASAKKASDVFVAALENEGVQYIFGVPGEENLDLLESIRQSNIKMIITRHEQAAGFMAATYGRLTDKAGVCLSTLGPGATNLVTAAAYAKLGAMPMVMITGQKPIKKSKQGRFQIIDVVSMMTPITKYAHSIVHGNVIPARIREAFRLAEEERPGPVHLELPEDIASEACESEVFPRSMISRSEASESIIQATADKIRKAKRPLILIGAGANRKATCMALSDLIQKTKIPFFNTQMGKGVVDERHPLFLGTAALSSGDYIHCVIDESDLVINVGHDVVEKPPFFMKQNDHKEVIHVNFSSAAVDEVYFPHLEVVGDIAHSIEQIARKLDDPLNHDIAYFEAAKKRIDAHIQENADNDSFPIYPQRLIADVRKAMPSDGIIALDNGMYKLWFARGYQAHQPNTILLDNALASMGAGLPSAMMAAILYPNRQVMAICGDGGFMMNSQELETAVRLKLNLVVLILRDDAYGMIRWKQQAAGFKDYALSFGNPDFVKYAESYGAYGHRVRNTKSFVELVEKCFKKGGVHVIDTPIDYSENQRVFTEELGHILCQV